MESPPFKISFGARVRRCEERKIRQWISGFGNQAVFNDVSQGWYMSLDGSHEAIFVGMTKPDIQVGDYVGVTMEKINDLA
jgi:hypothetical protein